MADPSDERHDDADAEMRQRLIEGVEAIANQLAELNLRLEILIEQVRPRR